MTKPAKPIKPKPSPRRLHIPNRVIFGMNVDAVRTAAAQGVRTLCDKPLRYNVRNNGLVIATYNERLVSLESARGRLKLDEKQKQKIAAQAHGKGGPLPSLTECPACFKLAALDDAALAEELGKRALKKGLRSDLAREKRRDARQLELEALDAKIAAAQIDALVCLDYFEANQRWPRRCDRFNAIGRCGHEHGHLGKHEALDQPVVDIGETVAVAIEAHKRARGKFDRGDKAYIFKTLPPHCPNCGDVDPHTGVRPNGACAECYARVTKPHAGVPRPIACRFCGQILLTGCKIGKDYSREYVINEALAPTVDTHTTICALRFLGKVENTTHLHLPDQSFVLEHDEEEATP